MIIGDRVRLRSAERDDVPLFHQWLNDPEVTHGLSLRLPFSLASEERWFEELAGRPASEQPLAIEIRDGDAWRLIGNSGFMDVSAIDRGAEIGLFIGDKSCWDRGYGEEVVRMLLDYGFGTLNLERVWLRVYDFNPRAIRCYEKCGFVHEGRLRRAVYKHGQYGDVLVMSVLRSEWEASRGRGPK